MRDLSRKHLLAFALLFVALFAVLFAGVVEVHSRNIAYGCYMFAVTPHRSA